MAGKSSVEDSLPVRGTQLPHSRAGVVRKVAHLTPEERVARGRRRVTRFPGPAMAAGSRPSTDPTLSGCSSSRA